MKYKILLLFVICFIFCCSVFNTYATGVSGTPYKFFTIDNCSGNILVRVYPTTLVNYSIIDCTLTTGNDWICNCRKDLYILIPDGYSSKFSALVQYNIGELKTDFIPSTNGQLSEEELYNENLKRIFTIKDIIINKKLDVKGALSNNENINTFLLFTFIIVVFIILVITGTFVSLWIYDEKLRRWLKLNDKENVSVLKILKKIFSRSDISKKTITGKKITTPITTPNIKKDIKQKVNVEDEVRKILEDLNK